MSSVRDEFLMTENILTIYFEIFVAILESKLKDFFILFLLAPPCNIFCHFLQTPLTKILHSFKNVNPEPDNSFEIKISALQNNFSLLEHLLALEIYNEFQ